MARRKAKVGPTQKLAGYSILAVLGVIAVWLLIQQSSFNPAVLVASRGVTPQAGSGQAAAALAALFPEVAGFTPLATLQTYGPDNLSDKIDGKAGLYLSAGFKEMACRSFRLSEAGQAYVEVFIYDMGSPQNAYAVFSSQRRPDSTGISLTANAYKTDNALFFSRGRFYVEIVGDRASEALQGALKTYATALLAKMPSEGATKDRAKLFPRQGLAKNSVRLSASDTFGLADFNNVLTGEYKVKNGYATAFVAERDTPEQAKKDAQRYREFLAANGYKKIQTPGAPAGIEVLALEDSSFEIILVQGKILAGVHDASSPEAAVDLANKLLTVLKEKQ
ncbi:MAG: hypothetical protein P8X65_07305 [Syntrophobacterales bacterium]